MYKLNKKSFVWAVGVSLAAAWCANSAMAQATYTVDAGGLESFDLTIDTTSYQDGLAGAIDLKYVSGTGSSFASVCTDVSGTLWLGYNYSYGAPTTFAGNSGLAPTWGAGNQGGLVSTANEMAAINAANNLFTQFGGILSNPSTAQSVLDAKAGLQLAVWAALYNTTAGVNSINLDGPRFSVSGPADGTTWSGAWGQTYVGTPQALIDAITDLGQVNFGAQYSGNDLLIPSPTTQFGVTAQEVLVPVPEPSTLIAGGLLLLPFAASAIRVRARNRG
jgi:hypothetical protein